MRPHRIKPPEMATSGDYQVVMMILKCPLISVTKDLVLQENYKAVVQEWDVTVQFSVLRWCVLSVMAMHTCPHVKNEMH